MADINAVAEQFIDFYYRAFDSNRSGLGPLYVRPFFVFRASRVCAGALILIS